MNRLVLAGRDPGDKIVGDLLWELHRFIRDLGLHVVAL